MSTRPSRSGRPRTNLEPTYDETHNIYTKYNYKKLLQFNKETIKGKINITVVGQLADGTNRKELFVIQTHD